MGQKLEILDEKVLEPTARIITAPFNMPTAIRERKERFTALDEENKLAILGGYRDGYEATSDLPLIVGSCLGTVLNGASLWKSIHSFSEGRTIEGLVFLIPIITNGISAVREIYRWIKTKAESPAYITDESGYHKGY